jgi:RecA/RadA recombinase
MNSSPSTSPSSGEEALRICETLVRSNALDIIVLDSVAALVTKSELEGEIGDAVVGVHRHASSSDALRKLTSFISKANTICLFTNQIREKIGVMFGNPENDSRRQSAPEFLRQHPGGQSAALVPSRTVMARSAGDPHKDQAGQRQGGSTFHRSRVRHHV